MSLVGEVAHDNGGAPGLTAGEMELLGPGAPERIEVVHRYPPAEVARAGLVLIGLGLGLLVLWHIQAVLVLMLLAVLLATAIEPLVNRLRRGPFSRGAGVLVVYTAIVVVIAVPAYLLAPSLMAQVGAFSTQVPQILQTVQQNATNIQFEPLRAVVLGLVAEGQQVAQGSSATPSQDILAVGTTALQTLISFVSVFVLAFYWLVERASIKRVVLRTVPSYRAKDVNAVWLEVEEKFGGWVRGQLLLMLAIGVAAGLGYTVIGVPDALVLGVTAGLFEVVPMLGPILAFAPGVLVALAVSPPTALFVLGYAVVVQQVESNVLVPRTMRETVGISPLTVLLGILIGASLYGVLGAFIAVPIAGALQVILAHTLRVEDAGQAAEHRDRASKLVHEGKATPSRLSA